MISIDHNYDDDDDDDDDEYCHFDDDDYYYYYYDDDDAFALLETNSPKYQHIFSRIILQGTI